MRLHRVTWVANDWDEHLDVGPYHPLFVSTGHQGHGRFDNPERYSALYLAHTPQAAVGEVFADLKVWTSNVFAYRRDDHRRCLVSFEADDARRLLDLDDARTLQQLALRPTDVVRRNRDRTQEVALQLWIDRRCSGNAGVTWWSYWRPEWSVSMLWSEDLDNTFEGIEVLDVEPLTIDHPSVEIAADLLLRPRER